jgi:IS30 family transposase
MCANFKYDKENIELRRGRVLELAARGKSQIQIAKELNVSNSTISLDLQYTKCKAQEHLQTHIQDTVVLQWEKTMSGLQQVLQKVWDIAEHSTKTSEKLEAYGLINTCYKYINDMSTDSTIISKALKFVLDNSKEQLQNQQQEQQDPSSVPAPVEESDPMQEVTEESE